MKKPTYAYRVIITHRDKVLEQLCISKLAALKTARVYMTVYAKSSAAQFRVEIKRIKRSS